MSSYVASTGHATIHRNDLLSDFTQDKRILVLSLMALVIGCLSAGVAFLLVKLIALITNLAFHFTFSTAEAAPTTEMWGNWVVLVPAIGGLVIGLMARYGSEKFAATAFQRRSKLS